MFDLISVVEEKYLASGNLIHVKL